MSKNVIIFGVDMRLSVHIDHIGKHILFLGIGPTLENATLSAEAQHSINFSRSNKKLCLSLYHSFLFVNATKLY